MGEYESSVHTEEIEKGLEEKYLDLNRRFFLVVKEATSVGKLQKIEGLMEEYDVFFKKAMAILGENHYFFSEYGRYTTLQDRLDSVKRELNGKLIQSGRLSQPIERVEAEVAREESAAVPDAKELREKAGALTRELKENGEEIIKAVDALLKRADLPAGECYFLSKDPELARLQIDIKQILSFTKGHLDRFRTDIIDKPTAEFEYGDLIFTLRGLYSLITADIKDELGKEIEKSLRPLFYKELELTNDALTKLNRQYYGTDTMLFIHHPRSGALYNEKRDYIPPVGGTVEDEEIRRGCVVGITSPGMIAQTRNKETGENKDVGLFHLANVVISSGKRYR